MKKIMALVMVSALMFGAIMPTVYAEERGRREMKRKHCDMGDIVSRKAMILCKNKDELGLSDEQVEKIMELNIVAKKDSIRTKAEIEITELDIKAMLWKDTIDRDAINKLIDKKYDLKKAKAKSEIDAYANLKEILTKEQREKLKVLFKSCKEAKGHRKEGQKK